MYGIINGRIIIGNNLISGRALIFEDTIKGILSEKEMDQCSLRQVFDAKGNYVSPGFIDIHTHGTMGHDTMDGAAEGLSAMRKSFAAHGVTGFLPTTMTMDMESIERALTAARQASAIQGGAKILGCHLEGPFISGRNAGAHDSDFVRKPDFNCLFDKDLIKIITLAPELDGAEEFIRHCSENGIVVSLGHSCGTYEEAARAIQSGARSMTHIFNAMTPLNHRAPGLVGAAMDRDVYCELIADNIHIHPAAQRILLKIKGTGKVILITDSMRASDMGDGMYDLGGQTVIVNGNSARLENGTLAGSVLTLDKAVRNFRKNTGISIAEAVRTVTENPARLLNLEKKLGSIEAGKAADITVFDEDFTVMQTFVDGEMQL